MTIQDEVQRIIDEHKMKKPNATELAKGIVTDKVLDWYIRAAEAVDSDENDKLAPFINNQNYPTLGKIVADYGILISKETALQQIMKAHRQAEIYFRERGYNPDLVDTAILH